MGRSFLLVDDDPVLLRGLGRHLRRIVDVQTAGTVKEAREMLEARPWSGLIVDVGLPDGNGFDVIAYARLQQPGIPAMVLTGRSDRDTLNRAFDLRVCCMVKPAEPARLINFVQQAAAMNSDVGQLRIVAASVSWERRYQLTLSEREVLLLAADGKSREEIALSREHALSTVRKHVQHLLRKTGDTSLSAAVVRLFREIVIDASLKPSPQIR